MGRRARNGQPKTNFGWTLVALGLRSVWAALNTLFASSSTAAETNQADWSTKKDVFGRSYDEVLTALKHQDEKLNRTLTAIAFLTAAGVTLFVRTPADLRFGESATSVTSVFFAAFLVSTVFALVLALAAIGPSTAYYGPRRPRKDRSLIFYASIASDKDWESYIGQRSSALEERLARHFHDEAKTISHRVVYKVARSRESGACVQLAVLSLSLLGIFSIDRFSIGTRWWLASVLLIALLIAPFLDLLEMRHFKFTEDDIPWTSYGWLALSIICVTALLIRAPAEGQHWPAMYYALTALTTSRLAYAYRKKVPERVLAATAVAGLILTFHLVIL